MDTCFGRHFEHPRYNKTDPYYLLTRWEQVTVFRLTTDHNRLNHHLYSKLRIGHTEQCPCGTDSHTTEHMVQSCPIYELLRKGIWPGHTPVTCTLYGSLGDINVLPPSSRRLEFSSDEREEEEETICDTHLEQLLVITLRHCVLMTLT